MKSIQNSGGTQGNRELAVGYGKPKRRGEMRMGDVMAVLARGYERERERER